MSPVHPLTPVTLIYATFLQAKLIKDAETTCPSSVSLECGDLSFPRSPFMTIPDVTTSHRDEWAHLDISQSNATLLEHDTRTQTHSPIWHEARKKRITASTFGRFMTRKAPISEKFLTNIFKQNSFSAASTSYGIANEKVARQLYAKQSNFHVHDCGFCVNPEFPFLGATPDAKVCDNGITGIVEIKCPYSIRDLTIADAVESIPTAKLFLERHEGDFKLKKTHIHWFQVQGQLLVTGAPFCDFVTYTRRQLHVQRGLPDIDAMTQILETLTVKYVSDVKPFLSGN